LSAVGGIAISIPYQDIEKARQREAA